MLKHDHILLDWHLPFLSHPPLGINWSFDVGFLLDLFWGLVCISSTYMYYNGFWVVVSGNLCINEKILFYRMTQIMVGWAFDFSLIQRVEDWVETCLSKSPVFEYNQMTKWNTERSKGVKWNRRMESRLGVATPSSCLWALWELPYVSPGHYISNKHQDIQLQKNWRFRDRRCVR